MNVLVTGGAGFIGSGFVRHLLATDPDVRVIVLDALTYAGNLDNLACAGGPPAVVLPSDHRMLAVIGFASAPGGVDDAGPAPAVERERWERKLDGTPFQTVPRGQVAAAVMDALVLPARLAVVVGNVTDASLVNVLAGMADKMVHFAAETHVDRSIVDADAFVRTDVYGTFVVLEAARASERVERMVHVSTDEVYGSATDRGFREDDPIRPCNPYSAAKAAADRLAFAYHHTHGVPVTIVRLCNVFGPFQYPEKLVPVTVLRALAGEAIPVYGDGRQVRDWLYVENAARAIERVMHRGKGGEAYNVAGRNERENLDTVRRILRRLGRGDDLIRHVEDRPGHDRWYSLDDTRIRDELGYQPAGTFEEQLDATVDWYALNRPWWTATLERDREYRAFMERWYAGRR